MKEEFIQPPSASIDSPEENTGFPRNPNPLLKWLGSGTQSQDWMSDGLCPYVLHPDFHFAEPGHRHETKLAKQVCKLCDVRDPCLEYGVRNADVLHGVWGGKTQKERRRLAARNAAKNEE